jgi:outer membrane protein
MRKKTFTPLFVLFGLSVAQNMVAQEAWSLQRCIGHALEQNLTIKQSQANVKTALLSESQARAARLPNASLSSSLNEQFGRTVDPSTNQFSLQNIAANTFNLNASMPIYTGGQIKHNIAQSKHNAGAALADMEQSSNTLALQVASAYLTVLLNTEQLENAQSQVGLSRKQLGNTLKLVEAGSLPLADRYNVEAQIAREEQSVITAENNLELAYLSLKQLMQMEPDFDLKVEQPEINPEDVENLTAMKLTSVYEKARTTQPSLRAGEFRIKSAHEGIAIAKAGYLPTVNLFGGMNAFFSSANKDFIPDGGTAISPNIPLLIEGVLVNTNRVFLTGDNPTINYFTQLEQTFGQSVGISLNVPIYQNGQVRLAVERAKLNVLNAQLQQNQTEQTLKNDIQTALANARNAKKQLEASQKTYDAAQLAYVNMEKRHTIGAVNALDLNTAKNTMDVAANNRTVARYDYLFRLKILEFYVGKPLLLEQK